MPQHVFLSYSHLDTQWVSQLQNALQNRGFSVWQDRERLVGGHPWLPMLSDGLKQSASLIAVLSPAFATSAFVHLEVAEAQATNKPIIPVLQAACILPSDLSHLSQLQFIDFVHNSFEPALDKLHSALVQHGISPAAAAPPQPNLDLTHVLPGAWNAVLRNQHGPFHLECILNANNTLAGSLLWPTGPTRIPMQGSWRTIEKELTLQVTQNNLAAGFYWREIRENWALTCHFTNIAWNQLTGFTLPDPNDPASRRHDCTWTRLS